MRPLRAAVTLGVLALAMPAAAGPDREASDLLGRMVGVWDATLQIAGEGDDPPLVINGTEIAVLGGGGAWLASDFRSRIEGRPFQGHGILTHDPRTGRFRRVWADSTSPALWISKGTYDGATDTLTMWIDATDSAGEPVRWREVVAWKGDDARTFTMYVPGPETREAAGMSIVYRRRQDHGMGRPAAGPGPSASHGPEHAVVARDAGAWKATVEISEGAGRPPDILKATETNALCCEGLFLVSDLVGSGRGRSFAGHGILGYDPRSKQYIRAWIDTADRALSLAEGGYDAGDKVLTLRASLPDGKDGTIVRREVLQWKGSRRRLLRRFAPETDGSASPGLSIEYRRLKD